MPSRQKYRRRPNTSPSTAMSRRRRRAAGNPIPWQRRRSPMPSPEPDAGAHCGSWRRQSLSRGPRTRRCAAGAGARRDTGREPNATAHRRFSSSPTNYSHRRMPRDHHPVGLTMMGRAREANRGLAFELLGKLPNTKITRGSRRFPERQLRQLFHAGDCEPRNPFARVSAGRLSPFNARNRRVLSATATTWRNLRLR
jgi:hypothetical protein